MDLVGERADAVVGGQPRVGGRRAASTWTGSTATHAPPRSGRATAWMTTIGASSRGGPSRPRLATPRSSTPRRIIRTSGTTSWRPRTAWARSPAFTTRLCFVGHSHRPAVWSLGSCGPDWDPRPSSVDVRSGPPLHRQRGKRRPAARPRSRAPRTPSGTSRPGRISIRRVPYDVAAARRKIERQGCPGSSPTAWPPAPDGALTRDRLLHALVIVASRLLSRPRLSPDRLGWHGLGGPGSSDGHGARPTPRIAFAWGWLFGTVFFAVLLRWLNFTFRVYSAIPWPLTWLPTFALAAYCALYLALFAAAVSWVGRRRSTGLALAVAPFLWVAGEWLRGHVLGGFPWGCSATRSTCACPVIQIAELGGVYAVSFVLVAANAALAACLVLTWRRATAGVALAGALIGATLLFGTARLQRDPATGGSDDRDHAARHRAAAEVGAAPRRDHARHLHGAHAAGRRRAPGPVRVARDGGAHAAAQDPVLLAALRELAGSSGCRSSSAPSTSRATRARAHVLTPRSSSRRRAS